MTLPCLSSTYRPKDGLVHWQHAHIVVTKQLAPRQTNTHLRTLRERVGPQIVPEMAAGNTYDSYLYSCLLFSVALFRRLRRLLDMG